MAVSNHAPFGSFVNIVKMEIFTKEQIASLRPRMGWKRLPRVYGNDIIV